MKKKLLLSIVALLVYAISGQLFAQPKLHLKLNEAAGATELVNSGTATDVSVVRVGDGGTVTIGATDAIRGQVLQADVTWGNESSFEFRKAGEDYAGVTGGAARTYALWIKPGADWQDLMNHGSTIEHQLVVQFENGTVRIALWSSFDKFVRSVEKLTIDEWNHLAIVVPQNANFHDIKIYINGVESATTTSGDNAAIDTDGGFRILRDYTGSLSDWRFYDTALTEQEIKLLAAVPLPDAILHLKLNEAAGATELVNSGTAADVSVVRIGDGGTVTIGATDAIRGQVLQADVTWGNESSFEFRRAGEDYAGVTGGAARTYAFWLKPGADWQDLMNHGGTIEHQLVVQFENGTVRIALWSSFDKFVRSVEKLTIDEWNHLAIVVPQNANFHDIKIYINGVESATTTSGDNAAIDTDGGFRILRDYTGSLSDWRFYDKTLTEQEIKLLAAVPLPNAVLHLKLNEAAGATELVNSGTAADVSVVRVGDGGTVTIGATDAIRGQVLQADVTWGNESSFEFRRAGEDYAGVTGGAARTYAFWLKPGADWQDLMNHGGTIEHQLVVQFENGTVRIALWSSFDKFVRSVEKLTIDEWNHLAIVVPQNANFHDIKIYINGVESATTTSGDNAAIETDGGFRILRDYTGSLSDWRFYDKALTEQEIQLIVDSPVNVSVKEVNKLNSNRIFPNPTNGILNIIIDRNDHAVVNIVDLSGRVIIRRNLSGSNNTIDLSSLNQGIYIMQLINGAQIIYKEKIVKIK